MPKAKGLSRRFDRGINPLFLPNTTILVILLWNYPNSRISYSLKMFIRKIFRFEPVKENGKPVSVVKQVEYSFMIY